MHASGAPFSTIKRGYRAGGPLSKNAPVPFLRAHPELTLTQPAKPGPHHPQAARYGAMEGSRARGLLCITAPQRQDVDHRAAQCHKLSRVSVEGCPVGDAPVGITVKSSPLAKTLKRAARITATVMRAKMRSQRGPFIRRRSPSQTQLHRALSRRPPFEHDCRRVSPHNLLDIHSKYWTPRSDRCRIKRQVSGKEVVTQQG